MSNIEKLANTKAVFIGCTNNNVFYSFELNGVIYFLDKAVTEPFLDFQLVREVSHLMETGYTCRLLDSEEIGDFYYRNDSIKEALTMLEKLDNFYKLEKVKRRLLEDCPVYVSLKGSKDGTYSYAGCYKNSRNFNYEIKISEKDFKKVKTRELTSTLLDLESAVLSL